MFQKKCEALGTARVTARPGLSSRPSGRSVARTKGRRTSSIQCWTILQEPRRPGPCRPDVPAGLRAGGRARVGRGARGCPGRAPGASERPAERLLAARASSPRSARLGLVPHFYVPAPRGCEPAPPPIGQRSVSGGDSDELPLSQLRGCSPTESALPLED